ncbi:ATP-dependent helicase [Salinibacterium sp. dk2585]|uniref:ATP-dependent helicase n=1 Tax=unclassified Salinibacterium TaxID=2632331 RepID=UPI0011C24D5B|nr:MULTISPECIES: ATP-dependent helicase [unclassified Salinibacterium]QEE61858.1 ATP-dependent helicase [Salinibacterium sp. dk2585]TXK54587.1 ATP-dependent helicase [Salinibacterium sp. dk5596]
MNQPPSADALLAHLDEEQREAAQATHGPVCMLAGAGTGKTTAITHRIAYGVASGVYAPNRVMALTFTAKAAGELRARLARLGAGGVSARTFHAAALSQLGYFWPQVIGGAMPRILESKGRMLGQAAERLRLRLDTATLRDLAAEIEWRKVSRLSLAEYAEAERTLPQQLDLEKMLALHKAYEDLKDERRQLDFEDVLLATAGMVESEPRVAEQVREQYRFFVVDEYQDVSPLQHYLLQLWLGDRRDLCVVGDASQTIYSFAGASSRFLLRFPSDYPDATVVRLERNYRSLAPIIETANRLMRDRPGALMLHPAPLAKGVAAAAEPPAVTAYDNDMAEARATARAIAAEIAAGTRPQDIAVLYRVNSQALAIDTALADVGVSTRVTGATRFFELPEVKQAVMMLKGAAVGGTPEPLFKTVSDVLRSLGWTQDEPEGRGAVRDRWESLNTIMALAEEAGRGATLRSFVDELSHRAATQNEPTQRAVTLATIHAAKGLEWAGVYLIGLSEGLLPISYAKDDEAIEEERRLLYVGVTRARERLHLSWSRGQQRAGDRRASRFLGELRSRTPDASARRS